jgi:hypothetical protein
VCDEPIPETSKVLTLRFSLVEHYGAAARCSQRDHDSFPRASVCVIAKRVRKPPIPGQSKNAYFCANNKNKNSQNNY